MMTQERQSAASNSPMDRKSFVRLLLLNRDLEGYLDWIRDNRDASRILNYLLFDSDEIVRWRAIEAVGRVAAQKAGTNPEGVREIIRRMLWAMNDESGNSFWHAPEVIGEVLANVPGLTQEFVPTIPSLMNLEPYERGVHWAMARIAGVTPEAFAGFTDPLNRSLSDPDPYIRGYALLALAPQGMTAVTGRIELLLNDDARFAGYDALSGEFRDFTVGECARKRLTTP
jgi:hypothetical protein